MDQILRDKTKLSIACSKSYAGNNIQFRLLIRREANDIYHPNSVSWNETWNIIGINTC